MLLLQCYQYFTIATLMSTFYHTVLLHFLSNRARLLSFVMHIPYLTYVFTSQCIKRALGRKKAVRHVYGIFSCIRLRQIRHLRRTKALEASAFKCALPDFCLPAAPFTVHAL